MAVPNPNPTRISSALWRLWTDFDAAVDSALLGGIWANKPGYHDYPDGLPATDYSLEDVAADRRGPRDKASAIDLTLSDEDMRLITGRLDTAARKRDIRLYPPGAPPVLREFIGTKDSRTVYCYVLTGGFPLGVGADAGPDAGRDDSHLWHIHLSIIRQYVADWVALSGVLSVMLGQSIQEWQAEEEPFMALTDREQQALSWRVHGLVNGLTKVAAGPTQGEDIVLNVRLAALASAIGGVDEAVAANLKAELDQVDLAVAATPSQVVSLLAAQPAADAAELLVASVGDDRARALAEAIFAATGGVDATE